MWPRMWFTEDKLAGRVGRPQGVAGLFCLAFLFLAADAGAQTSDEVAVLQRVREKEACMENLKKINAGLQAYRRVHKDLPDWLSDLVPDYLPDVNVFTCPVTRRTGKVNNYGLDDPKLSTSYLYEFCARAVPADIHGGSRRTMKEWKQRQMGLAGGVVPMVRCHQHSPVLNLSFDGRVQESAGSWEAELKDVIDPGELMPKKLFAGDEAREWAPVIIRQREAGLPVGCVDLSAYYNAGLTEPWHEKPGSGNQHPNDLGWLPQGLQMLGGIPFDVRGLIQVSSKELNIDRFPAAVQGIAIGRACSRIHFLHGTGWSATKGTRIGTYLVHYADGQTGEVPIVYGKDVQDWCRQDSANKEPVVAWAGKCATTQGRGVTLRLYRSQWQNPRTDVAIETIDFVSSMAAPAPFLVAVTLE